jgi:hypothetical protein
MTAVIATTAAAVVSDVVAVESAVLPRPMRTRPTAAKPRRTVNDPTARSAYSPPLVSAVRIVSVIEETANASVTVNVNVIEETVILSAVLATDEKTNASACIALVEIPVVVATSSITVKLAARPVQIVVAVGRVTLRVWRVGQRSDIAVIAVSGIVARVLDAVGGNALRSQKSRARRMRRLFTLAARKERLRRIELGSVYIDRLVGHFPLGYGPVQFKSTSIALSIHRGPLTFFHPMALLCTSILRVHKQHKSQSKWPDIGCGSCLYTTTD